MDYEMFLEGIWKYNKTTDFQQDYIDFVLKPREIWQNLENISRDNVENIVVEFLRRWNIRNPNMIDREELTVTLQNLNKYSQHLSQRELLDLNFVVEDHRAGNSNSNLIGKMYDKLKEVDGVGPTSTSKILHGINPTVFMMWEKEVRLGYGFAKNHIGYLRLLFESQRILKSVVSDYQETHNCSSEVAVKNIIQEANTPKKMSLTKLLDQYNFIKFKREGNLAYPCP